MRTERFGILGLAFLLVACTNAAPRTISFSPESKDGLVVFTLDEMVPKTITLTIARFDRESSRVTANSFVGQYFVEHAEPKSKQYVVQVPSGSYVIKDVTVRDYNLTTQICLSDGTISFDVPPGHQLYLGAFIFNGREVQKSGFDIESARAAMRDYPNITGELEPAEITQVTFKNSSRMGMICGG
jgi:hypothetical protein